MGAFSRFFRQKMKLFAAEFRRILEIAALPDLWRKFWAHYHDLCVQKRSCFLWSSDGFCKFSSCKVYRKSSWRAFTIYAFKNEVVCLGVQAHFGSSLPAVLQKVSGSIFTIFASKNEVVCREVQTHFGSSLPARFEENVHGAYSRFLRPKTKLFAVKFRCILELLRLQNLYKK